MLDPNTFLLIKEAYGRVAKKEVERISFETKRVLISVHKSIPHLPAITIEVRPVTSSTYPKPGDVLPIPENP